MRSLWMLVALTGCSNILGIHPLSDADPSQTGDARHDGQGSGDDASNDDGSMGDAPIDGSSSVQRIGEYNQLPTPQTINGNFIIARTFTVGAITVIAKTGTYLKFETSNGHIKFAIYSDNANSPFTQIAVTSDITLDGTAGYNEIAIGPQTLNPGTYWIVMATDSSVDIGSEDTNNLRGAAASLPYSAAFPAMYNPQPTSSAILDRVNLYLQVQ